jgi:hypothetical protein
MKGNAYESSTGVVVWKGDWEGAEWTITGYPNKEFTVANFDSAYDFEDLVKDKINCNGITFDSESCQFFAYAKTKARAISFTKAIDKHFIKVREMLTAK